MSKPKTPSVSDPNQIIRRRRNWRERKSSRSKIPEVSIEDFPSSSSQETQVPNPDSTVGDTDYYYSDSPPREGIRNKNSLHPPPEVE